MNLDASLGAEGVSCIIPWASDLRLAKLVDEVTNAVRRDNIIVKFGRWHHQFPNTRNNIVYDEHDSRFRITFAGRPSRENGLRYLFFLAHGWGHHKQHSSREDARLEASITRDSQYAPPSGSHLTEPGPNSRHLSYGSVMTGYEQNATAQGWVIVNRTLEELGWQSDDYSLLYWFYALVDHVWHRRCIADPHLPYNPRWWLAGEGFCMDCLLAPWRVLHASGEQPNLETLEQIKRWELVLMGADGCLHKPDEITLKVVALLADGLVKTLATRKPDASVTT